jgi:hypothetical protein
LIYFVFIKYFLPQFLAAIVWNDTNLQTFANIVGRNIFNNGIDFTRAIFEAKPSIFQEHKDGGLFFNSEALLNALRKFEAYHGKVIFMQILKFNQHP